MNRMNGLWHIALSLSVLLGLAGACSTGAKTSSSSPSWAKGKPSSSSSSSDSPDDEMLDPSGSDGTDTGEDPDGAEPMTTTVDAGVTPVVDAAPQPPVEQLPTCATPLYPIKANDESIDTNNACNTKNAIAVDGVAAGLDLGPSVNLINIDGHIEAGCLKVDFQSVRDLDPIIIFRRAVPNACISGTPCQAPYCGTGDWIDIFRGNRDDEYTFVEQDTVGDTQIYGRQFVYLRSPARYVVICRPGTGPARDDIEVDGVTGCAH